MLSCSSLCNSCRRPSSSLGNEGLSRTKACPSSSVARQLSAKQAVCPASGPAPVHNRACRLLTWRDQQKRASSSTSTDQSTAQNNREFSPMRYGMAFLKTVKTTPLYVLKFITLQFSLLALCGLSNSNSFNRDSYLFWPRSK